MKKIKIYSIVGVCAAAVLYMFDIAGNNNNIVNEIGKEWVAESRDMRGTGNLTDTNEESATSDESLLKQKSPDGLAEQILVRTGYTVSYNKDTKLPNWVSWYLTPERTTGPAKRVRSHKSVTAHLTFQKLICPRQSAFRGPYRARRGRSP